MFLCEEKCHAYGTNWTCPPAIGAKMTAVNRGQFAFTEELVKRIEYLELADSPLFQKTF